VADGAVDRLVCEVKIYERPQLSSPVLVEGLPGIGLVANITVAYLIRKLDAKLFGEIKSSYFHDVAFADKNGLLTYPTNQLYYYRGERSGRDLILLYGNTQALTARGQYELCGCILENAESLGCGLIITLGGYRPGRGDVKPRLYFAASDHDMARAARDLGAEPIRIQIFGLAGLLIGMCRLRNLKGLCLLSETPGTYPDKEAAQELLKALSKILEIKVDIEDLGDPMDLINVLPPFDFGAMTKKRIEKQSMPEWLI
jgi:uncharacterized protein (TIGR00162 family)